MKKEELIKIAIFVGSIAAMTAMLIFILAVLLSLFVGVVNQSLSTIAAFFFAGFLIYFITPEIGLILSIVGGYFGIAIATTLINSLAHESEIATTVFVNTMVGIIPFTIGYLSALKLKGDKISWFGEISKKGKSPARD